MESRLFQTLGLERSDRDTSFKSLTPDMTSWHDFLE